MNRKLIELEPRLLLAFQTLASELHFGRAARRLFMSQPPLSQQIKRLEEIVGVALFQRSTRHVSLTPAGVIFQAHVDQLLAQMDTMLKECRRASLGDKGVLTVGLTPAACVSPIVDMLNSYRTQRPDVSLELREVSSLETAAALRRHAIDVGVMRPGPSLVDIDKVATIEEEICLVVRKDHHMAKLAVISSKELASLQLIGYSAVIAPYLYTRFHEIFECYGLVPNVAQESSMPTIITLVEAGGGAALAPKSAVQSAALCAIPLVGNPAAKASLEIVMLASQPSSVAKNFASWIKVWN